MLQHDHTQKTLGPNSECVSRKQRKTTRFPLILIATIAILSIRRLYNEESRTISIFQNHNSPRDTHFRGLQIDTAAATTSTLDDGSTSDLSSEHTQEIPRWEEEDGTTAIAFETEAVTENEDTEIESTSPKIGIPHNLEEHMLDIADPSFRVKDPEGNGTPFLWDIPRSGGKTVKDFFVNCLGLVEACQMGGMNGHEGDTEIEIIEGLNGQKFVNVDLTNIPGIMKASKIDLVPSNLADLISTHHFHDVASFLFSPKHKGRMFAMFRHPVDRVVSQFYYLQAATWEASYPPRWQGMTLDEYANSSLVEANWVVRSLVNKFEGPITIDHYNMAAEIVRRKFLVGLMYRFSESMDRFHTYFGFESKKENVNSSLPSSEKEENYYIHGDFCKKDVEEGGEGLSGHGYNLNYMYRPEITEAHPSYKILAEKNAWDMMLFELVQNLFEEQAKVIGTNSMTQDSNNVETKDILTEQIDPASSVLDDTPVSDPQGLSPYNELRSNHLEIDVAQSSQIETKSGTYLDTVNEKTIAEESQVQTEENPTLVFDSFMNFGPSQTYLKTSLNEQLMSRKSPTQQQHVGLESNPAMFHLDDTSISSAITNTQNRESSIQNNNPTNSILYPSQGDLGSSPQILPQMHPALVEELVIEGTDSNKDEITRTTTHEGANILPAPIPQKSENNPALFNFDNFDNLSYSPGSIRNNDKEEISVHATDTQSIHSSYDNNHDATSSTDGTDSIYTEIQNNEQGKTQLLPSQEFSSSLPVQLLENSALVDEPAIDFMDAQNLDTVKSSSIPDQPFMNSALVDEPFIGAVETSM